MVVAPCSVKTLSGIVSSYDENLLIRAADVTLKERRTLVLLVRETPLHLGHLRLLTAAAELGAVIFPPVPAFYHRPSTIDEIVSQTVGRVLDQFGLDAVPDRWAGMREARPPSRRRAEPVVARTRTSGGPRAGGAAPTRSVPELLEARRAAASRHRDAYRDVTTRLRLLVADLAAQGESRLPSEEQLSIDTGVSRATLRSGLLALEHEGRVQRVHGRAPSSTATPWPSRPTWPRTAPLSTCCATSATTPP
jgi:hypothetical protein